MAQGSGIPFNLQTSGPGDQVVIPGAAGIKTRLRNINLQNQDLLQNVTVTVKHVDPSTLAETTIFGPLLVPAKQLIPIQDNEMSLALPAGHDLVIEISAAVQMLIFGLYESF
jgi:hypothetical protein